MGNPSILVIDDEPNNFDVIEMLLSSQYQLNYLASGYDAITSLDVLRPDLILLDVMMPGMDGIEVCQMIRAAPQWHYIPIIMVTALDGKEDLARCLAAGADDFISKPVSALELRARTESMLRIKYQYDKLQAFSQLQQDTVKLLDSHLHELRGNVTSSLSQEFNAPLTSILGSIGMLRTGADKLSPTKRQDLLDLAYQSALNLDQRTHRFMAYLQLEAVKPSTDPVPRLAIKPLIDYVATTKAQQFQRILDLHSDLVDLTVPISHSHLQRLVDELLDNAFKFSPKGSVVTVSCHQVDQRIEIAINDKGSGITRSSFQNRQSLSETQQNLGFGLKIVQKIVDLYEGTLSLKTLQQKGTTVCVSLPLR